MKTVRLAPPAVLGLLAGTLVTPVAAQAAVPQRNRISFLSFSGPLRS